MTKTDTLTIDRVANGYIVRPTPQWKDGNVHSFSEFYVFNTQDALHEWLRQQFPARRPD